MKAAMTRVSNTDRERRLKGGCRIGSSPLLIHSSQEDSSIIIPVDDLAALSRVMHTLLTLLTFRVIHGSPQLLALILDGNSPYLSDLLFLLDFSRSFVQLCHS